MIEDDKQKIKNIINDLLLILAAADFSDEDANRIVEKFKLYVNFLNKWSQTHNVVSRKLSEHELWENILDSIFLISKIKILFSRFVNSNKEILDAGSGSGFPGIPLAIVFSEKNFLLVDVNRKKCSFLRAAKAMLQLDNVNVINERIENLREHQVIITKAAFSPKNVSLLTFAASHDGVLAIWSTPTMTDDFVNELTKKSCSLLEILDYSLPSKKKRRLLVFRGTACST